MSNFFGAKTAGFCYDGKLGKAPDLTRACKAPSELTGGKKELCRMAQLMIGLLLVALFVQSLAALVVFRPPQWVTLAALAAGLLLIPGIGLTVLGRRRVALLGKVGGAVIAAARQTGRVTIADIAAQTQTSPDDVRTVVAMLTKRGAIPRDVEVS